MRFQVEKKPKTFTLLCIGHRGVGKTVFLTGCYAEFRSGQQTKKSNNMWIECQDIPTQENMLKILEYIEKTGQYPPATMKATDFHFSAEEHRLWRYNTISYLRWWDLPGEFCDMSDPEFQAMLMNSHGCCIFLDGDALTKDPSYLKKNNSMITQIEAIASLTNKNGLNYPFALIITKLDLLKDEPHKLLKIEENLQDILNRLKTIGAIYQRFNSGIKIESFGGIHRLYSQGASMPVRWLISEFKKLNPVQAEQPLGRSITQGIYHPPTELSEKQYSKLSVRQTPVMIGLASAVLISFLLIFVPFATIRNKFLNIANLSDQTYEGDLRRDSESSEALRSIVDFHTGRGQFNQAIPILEKMIKQEPNNVGLYFEMATLYSLTNQKSKEEAIYDQILKQQAGDLVALTSKAKLRIEQGDIKTAKKLFQQAEDNAPSQDLKKQIRKIANDALERTTQSSQP